MAALANQNTQFKIIKKKPTKQTKKPHSRSK